MNKQLQQPPGLLRTTACGLVSVLLIATQSVAQAAGQESSTLPRVAAVRYAIANGWNLAEPNIIVILESTLGAISGRAVPQTEAQRDQEAAEIAKHLGPTARTGRAREYLDCPSPGICFTAPGVTSKVLVVNGLFQGHDDILIRLYIPPTLNNGRDAMSKAIVDLERRGNAWAGLRYAEAPNTLVRGK